MRTFGSAHVDLESGNHRRSSAASGEEDSSIYFSDEEEGSCYSQFYSIADGSVDNYSFTCDAEILGSRRVSSVAESDCSVDIENGLTEVKVNLGRVERDCRICHMGLESGSEECGVAIELGCSCKDDLAAAHKHCAEAWFKIKGNKICEICNSIARNVVSVNDIEPATQQTIETNVVPTNPAPTRVSSPTETRSCFNGHRVLNFLLACMVFAFVLSWLFHFNIPS